MNTARYSLVAIVPALAALGIWQGGFWTLAAPVFVFGLVPLLELFFTGTQENLTSDEEDEARADWRHDALLFAIVPIQIAVLGFLIYRVAGGELAGWDLAGAIIDVGLCCGGLAINVGHELGHRNSAPHQLAAKVLLTTSLYLHFFIEHNRGHHARVATPDDPASSRYGETLYAFWVRSLSMGWLSAWRLEAELLRKRGHSPFSLRNQMLRFQLVQVAVVAALAWIAGPLAAGAFVAAAIIGALLLETVNYVEHYGLSRAPRAAGGYEKVQPIHSWNSNHPLGRALLFELTRHSDHHANPKRPYAVLRQFDESPQLPTGYPGMMLLATVPPLFFAVMHRMLESNALRYAQAR